MNSMDASSFEGVPKTYDFTQYEKTTMKILARLIGFR